MDPAFQNPFDQSSGSCYVLKGICMRLDLAGAISMTYLLWWLGGKSFWRHWTSCRTCTMVQSIERDEIITCIRLSETQRPHLVNSLSLWVTRCSNLAEKYGSRKQLRFDALYMESWISNGMRGVNGMGILFLCYSPSIYENCLHGCLCHTRFRFGPSKLLAWKLNLTM